ncbi:hypothetical protein LS684_04330 [Cytobacillus spongiae]|uniref:hypothetical protein n=1 Tax=Cytobacillus spongiae TaxID=2901381 RepID=UPI001F3DB60F|nr:hypothetical protein [Cytobacillus spongiae]UII56698.1 hypothetical protein LS684_04330 [Cytobacillus spongiae]
MSQVISWIMTEEERLAYIDKHPIKPTSKKLIDKNLSNNGVDFKWRGKKGNQSRYGTK